MAFQVGRDLSTTTGRNLKFISDEAGLDPWVSSPIEIQLLNMIMRVILRNQTHETLRITIMI